VLAFGFVACDPTLVRANGCGSNTRANNATTVFVGRENHQV
jgi:hypothetical protein